MLLDGVGGSKNRLSQCSSWMIFFKCNSPREGQKQKLSCLHSAEVTNFPLLQDGYLAFRASALLDIFGVRVEGKTFLMITSKVTLKKGDFSHDNINPKKEKEESKEKYIPSLSREMIEDLLLLLAFRLS